MTRPITESIADTLETRADDGEPLTIQEMRGIAAMLRSAAVRREVIPIGAVPDVPKIVPADPAAETAARDNTRKFWVDLLGVVT